MLFHMHENSGGIRALAVRLTIPNCRKLQQGILNTNLDLGLSVSPGFGIKHFPWKRKYYSKEVQPTIKATNEGLIYSEPTNQKGRK